MRKLALEPYCSFNRITVMVGRDAVYGNREPVRADNRGPISRGKYNPSV
jgi:hypothetical protein